MTGKDWDDFFRSGFSGFAGFGPGGPFGARERHGRQHHRRRERWFESGEMKLVILRLLKEKPRHGYDIIKALEERTGGCYTPSAGTVYPTLQLLEDQGLVRTVDEEGKKVYHLTPEGEKHLEEHRGTIDDIGDRLRDMMQGMFGGDMADLNRAFGALSARVFKDAWRAGPDSERTRKITDVLRRALEEIEKA